MVSDQSTVSPSGMSMVPAFRAWVMCWRDSDQSIRVRPDTDAEGALEVAEKLRATIAGVKLTRVDRAISASFGVAVHPDVAGDAETLLRLADRALYAAKGSGRNRVELAAATASLAGVGLGLAAL